MPQAEKNITIPRRSPEPRNDAALSRRNVIALAAAAATLGAGVNRDRDVAQTDPIFALIEAARAAWQRYEATNAAVERLEESVSPDVLSLPRVEIGVSRDKSGRSTPIYAYSHDQIVDPPTPQIDWIPRAARAEFRAYNRQTRKTLHQELQEFIERQGRLQREAGLTEAWQARARAEDGEGAAMDALLDATPATIEGALAVATFLREHERANLKGDAPDEFMAGFRTAAILERALTAMKS